MQHLRRFMILLVPALFVYAGATGHGMADAHAAEQVVRIQPSRHLCATPELRLAPAPSSSVVLSPGMFSNWDEVFERHPAALDYLLTPGDYTHWGPLKLVNRSGVPTRKRTIRYYQPGTDHLHPVRRQQEARIDAIDASGTTSHWLFHGLSIRKPSGTTMLRGASHLTFDSMLIEEARVYGMRIRGASHVCVQNSVIRNAPLARKQDSTGIQIKPDYGPVVGTRIVDNEIYNYGDSIQITQAADPWVPVDDTLIENNDLYLAADRTRPDGTACAENGIDIKAGSDSTLTKVVGNRLWGFRFTDTECAGSGSAGHAIVLHIAARNIAIERNIVGEAPAGVREKLFPPGWPPSNISRRVSISGNYFYGIRRYYSRDLGAAFELAGDVLVESNVIAHGDFVCDKGPGAGYRLGGPRFRGNTRIAVAVRDPATADQHPCAFDESLNGIKAEDAAKTFVYERKRWTGPEMHRIQGGY
jgi:hypothetical protein